MSSYWSNHNWPLTLWTSFWGGNLKRAHLWRLRPLPADWHQDVVGGGSGGGRGGAAGHCCGSAFPILAWRALQVIVTSTNHRCLTAWIQTNWHVQTENLDESGKDWRSKSLFLLSRSMTQVSWQFLLLLNFDSSRMMVSGNLALICYQSSVFIPCHIPNAWRIGGKQNLHFLCFFHQFKNILVF